MMRKRRSGREFNVGVQIGKSYLIGDLCFGVLLDYAQLIILAVARQANSVVRLFELEKTEPEGPILLSTHDSERDVFHVREMNFGGFDVASSSRYAENTPILGWHG